MGRFKFEDDYRYMMPAHFGGMKHVTSTAIYRDVASLVIQYRTERDAIEPYVPEALEITDPTLTVAFVMERRQQGEQFNVLDFAKLPEKPVTPNVPRILFGALFVGLAAGCGLALGLEYFDESFRTDSDLRDFLQMPVLAVIPHVSSEAETMKKRRDRLISYYLGGCLLLVMGVCVWLWLL